MSKKIVVAIDGPAGAGKSTVARRLAQRLGFLYIDTGAMYRAVALWALRNGTDFDDVHRLEQLACAAQVSLENGGRRVLLNGEDVSSAIRTQEISDGASKVSTVAGVRRALVEKQRQMAAEQSVVMEGRDIGTIVFPNADIKVYLDASVAVRAERRLKELFSRGIETTREEVEKEIRERDERDRTRAASPLMQAPDAVYLDSSGLSIEEVEEAILKLIRERTANGKEFSR
ncbi:MAG: (d)CMP kinase [Bryobacteraceae bacterium]|nr:(d)CMP kinase [Bryobacteraceae bacterium]MDW8378867.1 (d)CMP kinase [Bryobacterales bacterium]